MKQWRRALRFLCSMKCAVVLLLILALACTVGSLIPQGQTAAYYTANYAESLAGAILLFQLDDVFHCWWFVGLTLFLCANLLACNVLRFPALLKRMRTGFSAVQRLAEWDGVPAAVTSSEPEEIFRRMGFRHVTKGKTAVTQLRGWAAGQDGASAASDEKSEYGGAPSASGLTSDPGSTDTVYGVRRRVGIWGAWLCHLGMLIIIAGFGLGQMFQLRYAVYGVAGQTKPIGDTGYQMHIDDFQVKLRADDTVEQYETAVTVTAPGDGAPAAGVKGTVSVNHPLSLFGMKFYQNSTGWAARVQVFKGEEKLQEGVICAGEYISVEDMDGLTVVLNAFYPDYAQGPDGMPVTLSASLNNPGYLYTIYYNDRILGMNVLTEGQIITVEEYGILFSDPQPYTLLQIKRDPFTPVAAVGGAVVMLSLLLAFYLPPEEVWAVRRPDGTWALAGRSRKAGAYFLEELAKYGDVREAAPPVPPET